MCTLATIKDKSSQFRIMYSRIKKRRRHKKAIIAITRMKLIFNYHMLLTDE